MYKILITGDRNWTDDDYIVVKSIINEHVSNYINWSGTNHVSIIVGDARGVDTLAFDAAQELGVDYGESPFVADWARYGRSAGPRRNAKMLEQGPHLVLAFHNDLERSKGTKDCVTKATKMGVPVVNYDSNGGIVSDSRPTRTYI